MTHHILKAQKAYFQEIRTQMDGLPTKEHWATICDDLKSFIWWRLQRSGKNSPLPNLAILCQQFPSEGTGDLLHPVSGTAEEISERYLRQEETVHTILDDGAVSLAPGESRPEELPKIYLGVEMCIRTDTFHENRFDVIERSVDLAVDDFRQRVNDAFFQLVRHLAKPIQPPRPFHFTEYIDPVFAALGTAPGSVVIGARHYASLRAFATKRIQSINKISKLMEGIQAFDTEQGVPYITRRWPCEELFFILPQPKEFGDYVELDLSKISIEPLFQNRQGEEGFGYTVSGEVSLVCWGETPVVSMLKGNG